MSAIKLSQTIVSDMESVRTTMDRSPAAASAAGRGQASPVRMLMSVFQRLMTVVTTPSVPIPSVHSSALAMLGIHLVILSLELPALM